MYLNLQLNENIFQNSVNDIFLQASVCFILLLFLFIFMTKGELIRFIIFSSLSGNLFVSWNDSQFLSVWNHPSWYLSDQAGESCGLQPANNCFWWIEKCVCLPRLTFLMLNKERELLFLAWSHNICSVLYQTALSSQSSQQPRVTSIFLVFQWNSFY